MGEKLEVGLAAVGYATCVIYISVDGESTTILQGCAGVLFGLSSFVSVGGFPGQVSHWDIELTRCGL